MFVVRPGIYNIPNFGKLDTRKEISDSQYLALYENSAFPFIQITEEAVVFLKKQKLSEKRMIALISRATTKEELTLLLAVKSSKKMKALVEEIENTF
tara:strand:+ start:5870 stop:6160 length:291 start_codon:yes stop_codon:yes gene_type:complete